MWKFCNVSVNWNWNRKKYQKLKLKLKLKVENQSQNNTDDVTVLHCGLVWWPPARPALLLRAPLRGWSINAYILMVCVCVCVQNWVLSMQTTSEQHLRRGSYSLRTKPTKFVSFQIGSDRRQTRGKFFLSSLGLFRRNCGWHGGWLVASGTACQMTFPLGGV